MNQFALLLLFATSAPLHAQFGGEREKKGIRRDQEEKAWHDWLGGLGAGPVYRVEILYRHDELLYLCQGYLSPARPLTGNIQGFGLDAGGKPVPAPNPGYALSKPTLEVSSKTVDYPLAPTTRYLGVALRDGGPGQATIHSSDLATTVPLPAVPGEVKAVFFRAAAFRLEALGPEQVKVSRPLRQDPTYFRARTDFLQKELLAQRGAITQSEATLSSAARVLRHPDILRRLRNALTAWIDKTPQEVDGKGFPHEICRALADAGDRDDFYYFHRLVLRHPGHGGSVHAPVLRLVMRKGTKDAMPLLKDLLESPVPQREPERYVKTLRGLDPTVPVPTEGDAFLAALAARFKFDPKEYGLCPAQERLLELSGKLTRPQRQELEQGSQPVQWLVLSEAERRRGRDDALVRIRSIQSQ
jgi:hypothetical protein